MSRRPPLADRFVRRFIDQRQNPSQRFYTHKQFTPGGYFESAPDDLVDRSLKQARRIEMHDRVKRLIKAYGTKDMGLIMAMIQEEDERAKQAARARSIVNPEHRRFSPYPDRQTRFRRPR